MNTSKQTILTSIENMSNHEITQAIDRVFRNERHLQADFILLLNQIAARNLHIHLGYSSLMVYCVENFGLTEYSAYKRMQIARVASTYPALIEAIRAKQMSLAVASMIAPKLKIGTAMDQIRECLGKSKDQVKKIIAGWEPRPDVRESVRHMRPAAKASSDTASPGAIAPAHAIDATENIMEFFAADVPPNPVAMPREEVKPLSAERTSLRFSIDSKTEEKLERAKELLGADRIADIFDLALDTLLDTKDPKRREARRVKKAAQKKCAPVASSPQSAAATITPRFKDKVLARTNNQCTYVSPEGKQCRETRWLELEHLKPRGKGGDNSESNVTILCRAHNLYRAQLHYGREKIAAFCKASQTKVSFGLPAPGQEGNGGLKCRKRDPSLRSG
jgi:hypothetical protein